MTFFLCFVHELLFFFRNGLSVSPVTFNDISFVESVWVEIREENRKLLFGCVYRSDSGSFVVFLA